MKALILMLGLLLTATVAMANSNVTLAWDANTESDLAGYKVHIGVALGGPYPIVVDTGNVTTYTVNDLPDGLHTFVLTAYDISGNESGYSNEVHIRLDSTSPADPQNLEITIVIKIIVPTF